MDNFNLIEAVNAGAYDYVLSRDEELALAYYMGVRGIEEYSFSEHAPEETRARFLVDLMRRAKVEYQDYLREQELAHLDTLRPDPPPPREAKTTGSYPAMRVVNWAARQMEFEDKVFQERFGHKIDSAVEEFNSGIMARLFKSWRVTREEVVEMVVGDGQLSLHSLGVLISAMKCHSEHEESRAHLLRLKAFAMGCREVGHVTLSLEDYGCLEDGMRMAMGVSA